mmetsp:Transcript_17660/g.27333  ORF Transcript_17660/g.27333 Transcript_17660/m.27333 type:complete len:124 (-) Transcript_17660:301-672(-)|eukprot:CAMPEP_0170509820 /NCGR_PEP_ID=MMETSP0208-20121228/65425_1 /TAXON_ID=197538 /ORGANISM="Strombidium inclinatum, Strain S3" /LENGTH=123 /DNA_ID=CAMNT_0010793219 /DNA_START=1975 /DNA_END=2346 /DNA_ORIENTATION=-
MNKNGIGLGLMISQRILRKFGGAITFSSIPSPKEGQGTTFEFTMPLASEEEFSKMEEQERKGPNKYGINQSSLLFKWKPSPEDLELNPESEPESSVIDMSNAYCSYTRHSMRDLKENISLNTE